jgi:glycosyltransferase involved in cell wall biosynthesis
LVDQLRLGYGNSAIEAWCMGIPVVAGVEDLKVRQTMLQSWGGLPFYEANVSDLYERLAELITNSDLRSRWGQIGYQHALQYHDELKVSDLLANHYRNALTSVVEERTA